MTKKLDDIPAGITADDLADDLGAPKQPMNIDDADNNDDFHDDFELPDDDGPASGPSPKAEESAGIMHNHENARDNAELIVFLITLIVAFVLAKLVDIDGDMKEYEFDADQQRKIEKGFEIWFNSFENDFKLPVFLSWVAPLGMAIYDKTDKALDNRKAKKAAMQPPIQASIRRHPASEGYQAPQNQQFTQKPPANEPAPPPKKPASKNDTPKTETAQQPDGGVDANDKAAHSDPKDAVKPAEPKKKVGPGRPKGSKDTTKRKSPSRKKPEDKK